MKIPHPGVTVLETILCQFADRVDMHPKIICGLCACENYEITGQVAHALCKGTGVPDSFWLNLQKNYHESKQPIPDSSGNFEEHRS